MLVAEKEDFIRQVFSEKIAFEKSILSIYSEEERIEVMEILSERLICVLLREELNFLYMKDLNNFKFSLIVNLLFREIANEWVAYAEDVLTYNKEEALAVLQDKTRITFLLDLVKEYFAHYKLCFLQRIADSFINLIETMPSASISNSLIDEVLSSGFIRNENLAVVHSYSQLWGRVKNAHNFKKEKITQIQIKIANAQSPALVKEFEYEEEVLSQKPLVFFDESILRLRNTMIDYMMGIDSFKR